MKWALVSRRAERRHLEWGRVCFRAVLLSMLAASLFLIGIILLLQISEVQVLDAWWNEHLIVAFLGLVAVVMVGGVLLPLVRGLFRPLDQLPVIHGAIDPDAGESMADLVFAWRYFLLLGLLVSLPLFFYTEENLRASRCWDQYRNGAEARGQKLDPTAFIPPPVGYYDNFATTPFLAPLFDFLPGTQQWRTTNALREINEFSRNYQEAAATIGSQKGPRSNSWTIAQTDLPAWHVALLHARNQTNHAPFKAIHARVSTEEAARGILADLAEAEEVIEELRVSSLRPYSRFNIHYETPNPAAILLPHLSAIGHICHVLQLRACAELALGQTERGFADVQLMFRLTDACREEPILISHMVRAAALQSTLQPIAEGLARHQWSEEQLTSLEQTLARFDLCAECRFVLEADSLLLGTGVIDYLRRSPDKYQDLSNMSAGPNQQAAFEAPAVLLTAAPSGWFYFEKLNYVRNFERFVLPVVDANGHRILPGMALVADDHLGALAKAHWPGLLLRHQLLSPLLFPNVSTMTRKFAFQQTGADTASIACALERYRLANGQFPQSLDALLPQFIAKLPRDVINGQPLKYRLFEDQRYVIYSVGWNEIDDGGTVNQSTSKPGEALELKSGDWVWQLPKGVGSQH
jgi:hypothetical protein